jgi:hypothetical protein
MRTKIATIGFVIDQTKAAAAATLAGVDPEARMPFALAFWLVK